MAVVTFSITDELFEAYENNRTALAKQLDKFKAIPIPARCLVIHGEALTNLEKAYGKPGVTAEELTEKLEKATSVTIEDVQVALRPGQLKYIQGQARHYKEPFEVRARKVLRIALDSFLGVC